MRTTLLTTAMLMMILFCFAPQARADVHGIAFGFVQSVEANFDGFGGCRMLLLGDRYTIVEFPVGGLADTCKSQPVTSYFEVVVDDASPVVMDVPTKREVEGAGRAASVIPRFVAVRPV